MLFFVYTGKSNFPYSIKFELHDLGHTNIEVSFDGFVYRFPKQYLQDWLKSHDIPWSWCCKRTEAWLGEPHGLTPEPHTTPPAIRFSTKCDAVFFKVTWEHRLD